MSKRGAGEGSIYRRASDGKYVAAVTWVEPTTGSRQRKVFYGRTRAEASAELTAAIARREAGEPVADVRATLGDWVRTWLESSVAASSRRASTKALYRHLVDRYIAPSRLAARRLDQLRPSHLEEFVLDLGATRLKARRPDDASATVAPATVQRTFAVVRMALDGAVREGLLARNPAAGIRPPSVPRTHARFLTPAELAALFDAARHTRDYPLIAFLAATGARKGEALALRWVDVDLTKHTLAIGGTLTRVDGRLVRTEPKTASSRRSLPIPEPVATLLESVAARHEQERANAANVWDESGLVFTTELGRPIDPRNALPSVTRSAERAGLTGVTVHTLRHTAATTMLEAGVHLKAVSELLGHADIRITADVYGHVSTDVARAALASLAERVPL